MAQLQILEYEFDQEYTLLYWKLKAFKFLILWFASNYPLTTHTV